jgi:cysteinyl-tRNA synthetase
MKLLRHIFGVEKVVISPTTKNTTEELKGLHYKANDICFTFDNILISAEAASFIEEKLTGIALKIKDLNIKQDAPNRKREEILTTLRTYVRALRDYQDSVDSDASEAEKAKVLNYLLARQLLYKKQGKYKEADAILKQLKANKLYYRLYPTDNDKIAKFVEFQNELIDDLKERFSLKKEV